MAILAECPICRRKQATKNKICACGEDLDRAKRSKKVRYWIDYRIEGKARREPVGFSIEEARDAEGKRRTQKREGRAHEIFEVQAEAKMTFEELADWWLNETRIKHRADRWRLELGLKRFNEVFGKRLVRDAKLSELQNYQADRKIAGMAARTVDAETHDAAKAMVRAAYNDGLVSAHTWKTWENFKKLLSGKRRRSNKRDRVLQIDEYLRLMEHLSSHLKPLIATALYTGARKSELVPERSCNSSTPGLTWDRLDLKARTLKLRGKTGRREIPIPDDLAETLGNLPIPLRDPEKYCVFTYRNKPITDIRTGLKKACEKAEITYGAKVEGGFVFRDLRRTAKTYMARSGVDKAYRDALLGHVPQDMDDIYIVSNLDDLRRGMTKYAAWLRRKFAFVDQSLDQTTPES